MNEQEAITSATFDRLTEKQRECLGQIAIGMEGGHARATLQSLEKRGLLEREDVRDGMFVIHHYFVPLHVHIPWCQWCREHCEDEDE